MTKFVIISDDIVIVDSNIIVITLMLSLKTSFVTNFAQRQLAIINIVANIISSNIVVIDNNIIVMTIMS